MSQNLLTLENELLILQERIRDINGKLMRDYKCNQKVVKATCRIGEALSDISFAAQLIGIARFE